MCFSPAMYCNVTDSWTVADKWKRITISFAGIWVELIIASLATFVWWYTPHWPFVNNVAMCLMVLCSVSTFVFNANPLMRFDGYYILADWLEVPNLRERSNRYLSSLFQEYALGIETPPEPYMAPRRKLLFISYAIGSFVYRWIVTVSILFFLATWLKPYKLESLSVMLALAALGSMLFWPTYRWVKSTRQRGRLPDMKRKRVMVTVGIFAAFVFAFLFMPLPVTRVRETGLVQISEGQREYVHIYESGILTEVMVHDGQKVSKGADLGKFRNAKLEFERQQLVAERDASQAQMDALQARLASVGGDYLTRSRLAKDIAETRTNRDRALSLLAKQEQLIAQANTLKAPRAGVLMSVPKKDEIGKNWEKGEAPPFCTIGDPTKLRILVPVGATDYREIKDNLTRLQAAEGSDKGLEVSILPKNRSDYQLKGRVFKLPDTDEKNIPIALTHDGGGSLATKPAQDPNVHQPLIQTYLIPVEIENPNDTVVPGTMAMVKIHLKWRSGAWWAWRSISSALDVGLW
jgi:putative peptide zinc metalloprotease protein